MTIKASVRDLLFKDGMTNQEQLRHILDIVLPSEFWGKVLYWHTKLNLFPRQQVLFSYWVLSLRPRPPSEFEKEYTKYCKEQALLAIDEILKGRKDAGVVYMDRIKALLIERA